MDEAEQTARKNHKTAGAAAQQRMVNAARLAVLERNLGVPIKRNRAPDKIQTFGPKGQITDKDKGKEESIIIKVD